MPLLLERDADSSTLYDRLADARDGHGGVALVAGEAGIGKTTFVREFLAHAIGIERTLIGWCDPLDTPRPLGPLIDAARSVAPDLARRVASGLPRAEAFAVALDLIDDVDGPAVFVLEDLHWADEATLDLFTFLARRLDDRPALLVATFRSDEVDDAHPLRLRLGDVRAHIVTRIELQPLSVDAVAAIAADLGVPDADIPDIHRRTGGNPFYVTEVLASAGDGDERVPATVRDAVLARADRLGTHPRSVLDATSIVPGRCERWLLDELIDHPDGDVVADGLDTCCELGLLRATANGDIEFRHELGRLAIEGAVPARHRRRLHARALAALRSVATPVGVSRLAHHAAGADDGVAVLELAPVAATDAAAAGAHREVVTLLELALRYQHRCTPAVLGELWLRLADARGVVGDHPGAEAAAGNAAEVFEQTGDTLKLAEALLEQAGFAGVLGRRDDDLALMRRAEELLGDDPPPSKPAGMLVSARCTEAMLARQPEQAEIHGQRAMEIATEIIDLELYTRVAIQSGISRCMAGDDRGLERVRRGIDIGRQTGDIRSVAHGMSQIGSGYGELRRYDIAMPELRSGVEFSAANELVGTNQYLSAWLARCELETGDWEAAGRRAGDLASNPRCSGISRFVALVTLGWLRTRRGDPGADDVLDEALEFAREAHHIQRMWPAASARAEHAWLHDRLPDELPVVREALETAEAMSYQPAIEELAHWLRVAGEPIPIDPDRVRTPFGLSAAGRPDLAANAWDERGCPYEAAFARLLVGDAASAKVAHQTFEQLGGTLMIERAGRQLRNLGARVPRGPNRSTQRNPRGLTDRELDVLALLPTGCTNAEIGAALHISTKTAGHHVSRILNKLDVSTRAEAAIEAHRLGLG